MKRVALAVLAFAVLASLIHVRAKPLPPNQLEGLKYLKRNAKEEGVVVLPSGLQYKVVESGPPGGRSPGPLTPCDCHYKGTLIDGTEFDNSYTRGAPMTFAPHQVVEAWKEAMQLMKEGDKWELTVPPELGYGEEPPRGSIIEKGDVLLFTLEMVKVHTGDDIFMDDGGDDDDDFTVRQMKKKLEKNKKKAKGKEKKKTKKSKKQSKDDLRHHH